MYWNLSQKLWLTIRRKFYEGTGFSKTGGMGTGNWLSPLVHISYGRETGRSFGYRYWILLYIYSSSLMYIPGRSKVFQYLWSKIPPQPSRRRRRQLKVHKTICYSSLTSLSCIPIRDRRILLMNIFNSGNNREQNFHGVIRGSRRRIRIVKDSFPYSPDSVCRIMRYYSVVELDTIVRRFMEDYNKSWHHQKLGNVSPNGRLEAYRFSSSRLVK